MGRKIKAVYFNVKTDAHLLKFANALDNFSEWVKRKLANELRSQEKGIDPEVEAAVERLLEVKLAGRVVQPTSQQTESDEKSLSDDLAKFF